MEREKKPIFFSMSICNRFGVHIYIICALKKKKTALESKSFKLILVGNVSAIQQKQTKSHSTQVSKINITFNSGFQAFSHIKFWLIWAQKNSKNKGELRHHESESSETKNSKTKP